MVLRKRSTRRPMRKRAMRRRRVPKGNRNHLSKRSYLNATDVINKKFISTCTVAPTQGVTVANYIYMFFNLMQNNAGIPTLLSNNAEFILNRALYDRWRPRGITVTFVPHANTQDNALNQNDQYNYSGDGLFHTIVDRNGPPNSGDMNTFIRYGSHRAKSLLKKQSRSYWVNFPTNVWFQCAAPPDPNYITAYGGYGLTGGVGWYAENLLEDAAELFNETIGTFQIAYHVQFSGRNLPKIVSGTDLSGNEMVALVRSSSGGNPLMVPGGTVIDLSGNTTKVHGGVDISGVVISV